MEETTLDGPEWTRRSLLAMLAGVAVTISACGGGGDGGGSGNPQAPTPPSSGSGDKTGAVSLNHGHTAVITSAQLMAGGGVQLNIQGGADHSHSVALTAAEVVMVRDGARVAKGTSTEQAHDHTVTFN